MTFKTRWFGHKIEGENLKNLVNALGKNPEGLLEPPKEGWNQGQLTGRVRLSPEKDGIKVDLYVFRRDYASFDDMPENSLLFDTSYDPSRSFSADNKIPKC